MAQLTSWSPIFCRILRCFATKEMSAQPGIRTPDLLHVKPVCYHYATATSCNIELKVGSLNHLKYSLVSNFLSEINKAISYFIYLLNTLVVAANGQISRTNQIRRHLKYICQCSKLIEFFIFRNKSNKSNRI